MEEYFLSSIFIYKVTTLYSCIFYRITEYSIGIRCNHQATVIWFIQIL